MTASPDPPAVCEKRRRNPSPTAEPLPNKHTSANPMEPCRSTPTPDARRTGRLAYRRHSVPAGQRVTQRRTGPAARTDDPLAGAPAPTSTGANPAAGEVSHLERLHAQMIADL